MSEQASLVPLSHSLEAGTVGQNADAAGSRWDKGGTPSIKALALKVLQRDKRRDNSGKSLPEPCPTAKQRVGQTSGPVPRVAKPEPLLMRDGRCLWRWHADSVPSAASDNARALADEARGCGCVLVADGLDLIVVEPSLSELPEEVREGLAANAGTIIALLRGESRVRTGAAQG